MFYGDLIIVPLADICLPSNLPPFLLKPAACLSVPPFLYFLFPSPLQSYLLILGRTPSHLCDESTWLYPRVSFPFPTPIRDIKTSTLWRGPEPTKRLRPYKHLRTSKLPHPVPSSAPRYLPVSTLFSLPGNTKPSLGS